MFELLEPPAGVSPGALLADLRAAARAESRAAARRLSAIWQLYRVRLRSQPGGAEHWALDTWGAVAAESAAALGIGLGLAARYVRYARAMHERLPLVGMVLAAGDIDYRVFQTMVWRTDLITDPDTLAAVDTELAARAPRWSALSQGRLIGAVDRIVAKADADAVRRRRERADEREIVVTGSGEGLAAVYGRVHASDGQLFDERLSALAATVCDGDPRTVAQRRADAVGALAAGADRLGCGCGPADCPAGGKAAAAVVVHVVADAATVQGRSDAPGHLVGSQELIPAGLVVELAAQAQQRPLAHPMDAPAEPGYVPSTGLAEFVRFRDLTCRAPGCDVPASKCEIDHTIPYAQGGPTHASNLSCKCKTHHLAKTFLGWRDKQLPDGTLIWTLPDGQTYVTTPGSALLFPTLCAPTGDLQIPDTAAEAPSGDRLAMMPKRRATRAQHRAARIKAERRHNHQARQARRTARDAHHTALFTPHRGNGDGEPPPF